MFSFNLKRNGLIARYLGFVMFEPTYHPKSFCSLAWMLIFSPLIFLFTFSCYLLEVLDKKIEILRAMHFEHQVQHLLNEYHKNTLLALYDWHTYANWRPSRVPMSIIQEAFSRLEKSLGVYDLEMLVAIGALKSVDDYNDAIKNLPVLRKEEDFWTAWKDSLPAFITLGLLTFALSPLLFLPEGRLIVSVLWIGFFSIYLIIRLEIHTILYNLYRAVKDRACPIIDWV